MADVLVTCLGGTLVSHQMPEGLDGGGGGGAGGGGVWNYLISKNLTQILYDLVEKVLFKADFFFFFFA